MAFPEPRIPVTPVNQVTGKKPDPDPLLGTLLGDRYRLFSLLGEGGMGRVYLGEHALMRKRVAIKVLHRELTQVPEVLARFEREAMAAANIDHPNIAAATDFGKFPDGHVFLVLEYVQGKSLRELIADGPLPVLRALHIARQMASALVSAHALGIVHRDLKPENVMLVEKGGDPDFVKVLDFGVAKVPVQEVSERGSIRPAKVITRVGMIFGTPEYMAPEQALGQNVDARADLYALGIILFEMLSGRRPFSAESPVGIIGQQLQGPLPTFAKRAPHVRVPFALEQIILRLLAPQVASRFQTAVELAAAFDNVEAVLAPKASDAARREPQPSTANIILDDNPNASTLPAPTYETTLETRSNKRFNRAGPIWRNLSNLARRPVLFWGFGSALAACAIVAAWLSLRPPKRPPIAPVIRTAPAAPSQAVSAPVPTAEIATASEAQLSQASSQGPAALTQLAQSYPKDTRVWVELARAQLAASNAVASVDAAKSAVLADPAASKEAKLATVLWKTAQRRESSEPTLRLLAGGFGERGADILYDLTTTPGVRRDVQQAASSALASAAAQDVASPALQVLLALERAKSCEEKRALLPQVERDADARALSALNALHSTVGCGKKRQSDCFACLRRGLELENAIQAVKKREGS